MPPETDNRRIDYQDAAEQLLAVLSQIAAKRGSVTMVGDSPAALCLPPRPVAAGALSRLVFGPSAHRWSHETRRRRIRDTVKIVRKQLTVNLAPVQICASGEGYWIASDPHTLAAYAARRRRQGLTHLVAAAGTKPNVQAAAGQQPLFAPVVPQHRY